ncbi:MAG: PD-(D/E)XK nuclease family protein [Candidatus Omnitrophota bacterium]
MEKVITYQLSENFIERLSDMLAGLAPGGNLGRYVCVFGGRRPALFLNRALAVRFKKSFIPPVIFSIDSFVDYILGESGKLPCVGELDASYLMYQLVKERAPGLLSGKESFAAFLTWAQEMVSFIEQLDLEDISDDALTHIEKSAAIGYEIPESINRVLTGISTLRAHYHEALTGRGIMSRGMRYRQAAHAAARVSFGEFDRIFFCGFFYLHATERAIIREVLNRSKGTCIFQGDSSHWSVLEDSARFFSFPIVPGTPCPARYELSLYQGFDMHSQCALARTILATDAGDVADTVILLPRPETAVPLLTEVSSVLDEYNISMGYSLKRTPLYALCVAIGRAQESRKHDTYYSRDYLSLLMHPLAKNLNVNQDPVVTRIIVHTLQEILQGRIEASIGGSVFVNIEEIEQDEVLYHASAVALQGAGITVTTDQCKDVLSVLHALFFKNWERLENFKSFSVAIATLLEALIEKSILTDFVFNVKVIEKLQAIQKELAQLSFCGEPFGALELWEIFRKKLEGEMISFVGSPLHGTQILGLFETRLLNFQNVIVLDANESVLPKLTIYEPLIPREVMLNLGLNRLEKEEEIQRYQFMRLIEGAARVHLIYEENQEKEKSRFIEELIWRRQKEAGALQVFEVPRANFRLGFSSGPAPVAKTPRMIEYIKAACYSASRINTYVNCPLRFYYQYVLGLKEKDDLLEEPQAQHIGTFIHELLEEAFAPFVGKKPHFDKRFKDLFFTRFQDKFDQQLGRRMKSDAFLLKHIMRERLSAFLEEEATRPVARIISLEHECTGTIALAGMEVPFKYMVDRVDEMADGSIVIIDYKTGSVDAVPAKRAALESLELSRQTIKKKIKSFQLPIYYYFLSKEFPSRSVNAELYSVRTLAREVFISEKDYPLRDTIMQVCLSALSFIFGEIINPDVGFVAHKEERKCQNCIFTALCV